MMSSFRVYFTLDEETAKNFKIEKNKPALIAEALKWYLSLGKETLDRLARIESILSEGVVNNQKPRKSEENQIIQDHKSKVIIDVDAFIDAFSNI